MFNDSTLKTYSSINLTIQNTFFVNSFNDSWDVGQLTFSNQHNIIISRHLLFRQQRNRTKTFIIYATLTDSSTITKWRWYIYLYTPSIQLLHSPRCNSEYFLFTSAVGSEFHPQLHCSEDDLVVSKGMDRNTEVPNCVQTSKLTILTTYVRLCDRVVWFSIFYTVTSCIIKEFSI